MHATNMGPEFAYGCSKIIYLVHLINKFPSSFEPIHMNA